MSADNLVVETVDTIPNAVDSEPIKPAESAVTEAVVQDPPEGSENLDKPTEIEKGPVEESKASDNEETVQYLELDGKEHDLEDIRKWRDGHMMQADYTKKTTAHARQRDADNAELKVGRETLTKQQAEVSGMKDLLQVLVAEDEAIDWVDLKDKDLETYVELKEKADARKKALGEIQAKRSEPVDDPANIATEQGKLFAANPEWLDDDKKITEAFTADTKLMNEYCINAGFDPDEYSRLNKSYHMTTILKAAKYDVLQEKGRKIKAQRDKVHIVTKPKTTVNDQSTEVTAAQAFFPNMK